MREIAAPPRTADVTCAPAPLTAAQVASYHEDGYLVVREALSAEEIAQLHAETVRICRGERGALRNGLTHPVIVDVLTQIIGPDVKCMQSMLFVKSAGKPGQAWHQDEDYMSAQSLLPWMQIEEGTWAATADYRDIVMVAGKDPYAWKGVTDLARPSVRPGGEGGCAR